MPWVASGDGGGGGGGGGNGGGGATLQKFAQISKLFVIES